MPPRPYDLREEDRERHIHAREGHSNKQHIADVEKPGWWWVDAAAPGETRGVTAQILLLVPCRAVEGPRPGPYREAGVGGKVE